MLLNITLLIIKVHLYNNGEGYCCHAAGRTTCYQLNITCTLSNSLKWPMFYKLNVHMCTYVIVSSYMYIRKYHMTILHYSLQIHHSLIIESLQAYTCTYLHHLFWENHMILNVLMKVINPPAI